MDHATCHTSKGPVQIAISSPNHSRLHYVISSACVPILIKSLATIIIQKYKIKYSRPMAHPFLKSRAFRNECTRLVMWTLLAYSRGILPRGLICAGSSSMSRGVLGYNGVLEIMPRGIVSHFHEIWVVTSLGCPCTSQTNIMMSIVWKEYFVWGV